MKFLEIYNNHNTLQIDDSHSNLQFKRKISGEQFEKIERANVWYNYRGYRVPINEDEKFIAINSTGQEFISYTTSWDKNYIYFYFRPINGVNDTYANISTSIIGYVFGEGNKTPSRHMVGFECYNEKGEVVYSSKYKYMKVLDFINGDIPEKQISNKKIAMIYLNTHQSYMYSRRDGGTDILDTANWTWRAGYIKGNKYGINTWQDNMISERNSDYEPCAFDEEDYEAGKPQFLIIDVTGL